MRALRALVALLCAWWVLPAWGAAWAVNRPKLVVVIVIDQFRGDYISRYQNLFAKDGFRALVENGAYFPYGEYGILQSMTGPGHATVLTGAYPYQMGIPINDWYDHKTKAAMYCVSDPESKVVGGHGMGASPRNLIGTTVGDELKNVDSPSKVVTLALKDRAAVLLGGHRADLAMWFDGERWVSSLYYRKDGKLPSWMDGLNASVAHHKCDTVQPCGAAITSEAFIAALQGEKLGRGKGPDILAVSFSSHDLAGHHFGPNSVEIKDMTLAEDKAIAEMRKAVDKAVPGGLKNVVFVLTGDHGVAPTPEYLQPTGIDSARIDEGALIKEMNEILNKKFGTPKVGQWVPFVLDFNFFLDEDVLRESKADRRHLEAEMKEVLLRNHAFAHVVTRSEIEAHQLPPEMFARLIARTYYPGRSGNVIAIQKPFFINSDKNIATHMTGYTYDRMVPIVLSGFGIKNGLYASQAEVVDIAPTLSFLLGVLPPALSEGRVLSEALK